MSEENQPIPQSYQIPTQQIDHQVQIVSRSFNQAEIVTIPEPVVAEVAVAVPLEPVIESVTVIENLKNLKIMSTETTTETTPKIAVIGCGNMGINTLIDLKRTHKLRSDITYIAVDADAKTMSKFKDETGIENTIIFSKDGFGFGMKYELAKDCFVAENKQEEIWNLVQDKNIVFIYCGFGGGSGAGSALAIVDFLKSKNIVTVVLATLPSLEEGSRKRKNAIKCKEDMIYCNSRMNYQIIDCQNIYDKNIDKNPSTDDLNAMSSIIVNQSLNSILTILTVTGKNNIDFNDVRTALCGGRCLMIENSFPEADKTLLQAEESAKQMLYACENKQLDNFGYMLFNVQSKNEIGAKDRTEILKNYKTQKGDQTMKFGYIETNNDYFDISIILGGLPDYDDYEIAPVPLSLRERLARYMK